jgi:hypothetical protein
LPKDPVGHGGGRGDPSPHPSLPRHLRHVVRVHTVLLEHLVVVVVVFVVEAASVVAVDSISSQQLLYLCCCC